MILSNLLGYPRITTIYKLFIRYPIYINTHSLRRFKVMRAVCWCVLWTRLHEGPFGSACSLLARLYTFAPSSIHPHLLATQSKDQAWCLSKPAGSTPTLRKWTSLWKEHAASTCRASACREVTTTMARFPLCTRVLKSLSTDAGTNPTNV